MLSQNTEKLRYMHICKKMPIRRQTRHLTRPSGLPQVLNGKTHGKSASKKGPRILTALSKVPPTRWRALSNRSLRLLRVL